MRKNVETIKPSKDAPGNSLTACISSYLGVPINKIDNVERMSQEEYVDFLEDNMLEEERSGTDPFSRGDTDDYYIAWGEPSFESDFYHYVIMKDGELFHDPSRDSKGLKKVKGYFYFEPIIDSMSEEVIEENEEVVEDVVEEPVQEEIEKHKSLKNKDIDEDFVTNKLRLLFHKMDPYSRRALFKLDLLRTPMDHVYITAERVSNLIETTDDRAWLFVYKEFGRGGSTISKKLYSQDEAFKFVHVFKWLNNIV